MIITLKYFIETIEKHTKVKAKKIRKPMQPGDVNITYANIKKAQKLLKYSPKVPIEEGIKRLVEWYKKK